jgi:hypothetical protein
MEGYCPGSIDEFKFTYQAVKAFLEEEITLPQYEQPFGQVSESQKVDWALGFQSDFNGWLNHSRPRYGKKGCMENPSHPLLQLETEGLVHPGMLGEHWSLLQEEGVDLAPIRRASEKFLQVWQYFLDQQARE